MINVTDFALGAEPLGPAPSLPPVRRLLSRLVSRIAPLVPDDEVDRFDAGVSAFVADPAPVAVVTPAAPGVETVVAAGVGVAAVARTAEDLTCSWPGFVKGMGLESMQWMDTPDGPVLVGRFAPPVPRRR